LLILPIDTSIILYQELCTAQLVEYFELFDALLSQDPYCPENLLDDDFETDTGIRFYSHDLDPSRELSGCRALDIIYLQEHYRIVYRVDNRPKFRRVDIISFDRHNPAYDKAANRTFRSR
jgi:mRNA interferase RelE/StbE